MGGRYFKSLLALLVLTAIAIAPASSSSATPAARAQTAAEVGQWGPLIDLDVHAIHAVVLRTGKVLLYGPPEKSIGSAAVVWDPATNRTIDVSLDFRRDIFCGASSVLADGRVFVTGGTAYNATAEVGTRRTHFFDPLTLGWRKGPNMDFKRWYPSNVELPDGRILIFSGQPHDGEIIEQVEVYDPATNTIGTLPRSADRDLDLYPRIHLLPGGKLFVSGRMQRSQIFDPRTNTWSGVSAMHFGDRYSGNSLLLPGLGKIFTVGGSNQETGGRTTDSAEVIDLTVEHPSWRLSRPMSYQRRNANAVQLPDGDVAIIGGGQGEFGKPVLRTELFDPDSESWTPAAKQNTPRGYHSVAVLLPDGRVLSAGRHHGATRKTGEVYSPPYLFRGPRPVITSAPVSSGYGQELVIETTQVGSIEKVVLIRPGSVTHATDFDQRYVELVFEQGVPMKAIAPPDPTHAPPGYYMLFVVNSDGVPSEAAWVHLS